MAPPFIPNDVAIKKAVIALKQQPGGGVRTPDDMAMIVFNNRHLNDEGSNGWVFWQAVYNYITKGELPQ